MQTHTRGGNRKSRLAPAFGTPAPILTRIIGTFCLLAGLTSGLEAQTVTGSIVGTVQDPSGSAIPAAEVKLSQTDTGLDRTSQTNRQGDFTFLNLEPGNYAFSVMAKGFKRFERTGLVLNQSGTLPTGVTVLEIGALADTVTVTTQGATVQTASSERGDVVTLSQVEAIPVRGRNAWDLMLLMPGISSNAATSESIARGVSMDVNGSRTNTLSVMLDGMGLNQIGSFGNELLNVSMDAVEEVRVLTTNYQAEFGRTSGGELQIAMKSGKKDFHGLFSYFKRNEEFNANTFFNNRNGLPIGRYRYNTFDYNIGGPVYIPGKFNRDKNKLFFFFSQEFWPTTTTTPGSLSVPTALERAGNYSQSFDVNNALIPIVDPTTRAPVPGNIIPASRLDPSGTALLNIFPMPNFANRQISGGNYNYAFQAQTSTPQRFGTLRMDYNINSRNQLYATYSFYLDSETGWKLATTSANWNQLPRTYWTNPKLLVLHYNFVASPTLLNELTVGANGRREEDVDPAAEIAANNRAKLGFTAGQFDPGDNPLGFIPNATFGGVPNPANLTLDVREPINDTRLTIPISDTLTKTMSAHVIKIGFAAERMILTGSSGTPFNGTFSFAKDANNPLDTGYAYSNASFGVFDTYTEQIPDVTETVWVTSVEGFAQDSWKINRRLTLDYGLRFSHIGNPVRNGNVVSTFNPAFWNPAQAAKLIQPALVGGKRVGVDPVSGTIYPNAAVGAIAPDAGNPANGMVCPCTDKSYPDSLQIAPVMDVAPRIGFAWDPFGDGKTAIRGGGGIFYQHRDVLAGNVAPQSPIVSTPIVYYGTMPTLLSSAGLTFPSTVTAWGLHARQPYNMNTSLAVQRNVGFGTVLDVAYVGSFGRHLDWVEDLNSIPLGSDFLPKNADPTNPAVPLPASFLRSYAGLNNINSHDYSANSSYHALQVSANRRFARSLQFGSSWTWSRTMDYVDADATAVSTVVSRVVWNYGPAGFDHTHNLKLNYLWDVPGGRSKNWFARYTMQGWQLTGITSFISGAPTAVGYTLVTAKDISGSPDLISRINVTGNPVLSSGAKTFSQAFNTSVFAAPAVGSIGTASKFPIRGPGVNNWDISLLKDIPVHERFKIQFRCEAYNAFNHPQFTAIDTTARFSAQGAQINPTFGQYTATSNARILQLGLRASF